MGVVIKDGLGIPLYFIDDDGKEYGYTKRYYDIKKEIKFNRILYMFFAIVVVLNFIYFIFIR